MHDSHRDKDRRRSIDDKGISRPLAEARHYRRFSKDSKPEAEVKRDSVLKVARQKKKEREPKRSRRSTPIETNAKPTKALPLTVSPRSLAPTVSAIRPELLDTPLVQESPVSRVVQTISGVNGGMSQASSRSQSVIASGSQSAHTANSADASGSMTQATQTGTDQTGTTGTGTSDTNPSARSSFPFSRSTVPGLSTLADEASTSVDTQSISVVTAESSRPDTELTNEPSSMARWPSFDY